MPDHHDLVRRVYDDVFNKVDLAACDDLFADRYVEHARAPFQQTEPGEVNGPEHMRGVVQWLRAQFSDIVMTVQAIAADGDLVAVRVHTAGTNDGMLNGIIPPTGKRCAGEQTHWYRVEDGKFAEHWATRDDLTMMVQLGLVPGPGAPPPHAA